MDIETINLVEFHGILVRIRELPGVSNSETCPLLRQMGGVAGHCAGLSDPRNVTDCSKFVEK